MRTVRLSEALPHRAMNAALLDLLDAVMKLSNHPGTEQQAIQEDFRTVEEAKKATTALRNYCKNNKVDVCIAYPVGSKTITLYKGKPRKRSQAENNAPATPSAA